MYSNKSFFSEESKKALIKKLKPMFAEHPLLYGAVTSFIMKARKEPPDSQFAALFYAGVAEKYEQNLKNLSIDGVKPDVYFLERRGQLILEFSYHYFCRLVSEKYGDTLSTLLIFNPLLIEEIDVLEKKIRLNKSLYTELEVSKQATKMEDLCGVIVLCDNPEKPKTQFFYNIKMLVDASAGGLTLNDLVESESESSKDYATERHKKKEMIKKTALRFHIKNNYRSLNFLDEDPEDSTKKNGSDDNEPSKKVADDEALTEALAELEKTSTLDELKDFEKKFSSCSTALKAKMRDAYLAKKESLLTINQEV